MLLLFKRFSFYTFTKLLTSLSVLVFKKQNISICQKKASTMQKNRSLLFDLKRIKKRNNFFNCLSAFIVWSFSFITKLKFFSFCFTWTTKKKGKSFGAWTKKRSFFLLANGQQIKKIVVQQWHAYGQKKKLQHAWQANWKVFFHFVSKDD